MRLEVITRKPASVSRCTPVLFVHGMWHAAWCWEEHFLPYFSQHGYASHALSLRGHGGSERYGNLRWASLDDYASDLAEVAGQFEVPPVLVCHSMGSMVAQRYLESHQASAIVFMAPVPATGAMPATMRIFLRHPWLALKANLTLNLRQLFDSPRQARDLLFSQDMPEERVAFYFDRLQDESFRVYLEMQGLNLPRLKSIDVPLLVTGAENDRIISAGEVAETGRRFGVEAECFPDMAHDMMLESGWRLAADRIIAWLDVLELQ